MLKLIHILMIIILVTVFWYLVGINLIQFIINEYEHQKHSNSFKKLEGKNFDEIVEIAIQEGLKDA
ncbi:MAG: hypothetical protein QXG39_04060 [Candidatus Aenigmatarchaeota archaeon]